MRSATDFPVLDTDVEVRPAELTMAGQVVESMAADFHPEQYTDTYQAQLRELVEAKLAGGEAFTSSATPPGSTTTKTCPTCWPS